LGTNVVIFFGMSKIGSQFLGGCLGLVVKRGSRKNKKIDGISRKNKRIFCIFAVV
jgi:hypothetical protein